MNGLGTWGDVSCRVLFVVNSPAERVDEVSAVLDRLPQADVHVIAPLEWQSWLEARALEPDRIRYARDSSGRAIELNYFLEQFETTGWILRQSFDFVTGSVPHSLYNEEIKSPLEIRVGATLGQGRFVAHALPGPFLYLLTRGDLIVRQGRARKVAAYSAMTRALVDDLQASWAAAGRPVATSPSTPLAERLFERHLGALAHFDEARGLEGPELVETAVAVEFLSAVDQVWHSGLQRHDVLCELAAGLQQEVNRRDTLLATQANESSKQVEVRDRTIAEISEERRQAVTERDAIIDQLRLELERLTAGWRRAVVGRPRV